MGRIGLVEALLLVFPMLFFLAAFYYYTRGIERVMN